MTAVTMEMLQVLLNDVNERAKQDREELTQANKVLMTTMMEKLGDMNRGGKNDLDKICKLSSFKGEERKFHEWITKLQAHLTTHMTGCEGWLTWAMSMTTDDATEASVDVKWGAQAEKVKEFSSKVYRLLVNITEDEAFKICQNVEHGEGLEAMRRMKKRYDPRTPGTKRSLLKALMNSQSCKKVGEVQAALMRVEEIVKR